MMQVELARDCYRLDRLWKRCCRSGNSEALKRPWLTSISGVSEATRRWTSGKMMAFYIL